MVEKPTVAEEAKAEEAKAEKEKAEEANAEKEKPEEAKAEEVEEEVKEEEKEEGKVEEKEEVSQTEPTNTSSTYLWCLLLEVSLGSRHTIVPHLTRLLLQAFSHQTAPSDIALTHLPLLTRLLQAVKAEEQRGDFHAAAFGGRSSPLLTRRRAAARLPPPLLRARLLARLRPALHRAAGADARSGDVVAAAPPHA